MMDTNFAETIATLATDAVAAHVIAGPNGRSFMVTPNGVTVGEITDPHGLIGPDPIRINGCVKIHSADSLVEYANTFKNDHSLILADVTSNTVRVALDYHAPDRPQHVQHNAVLGLAYSQEWKTWLAINDRMMSQLEFARFIEENASEIAAPKGAELLEIVRDLQMLRKVDFRRVVRTASGDERFEYTDETTAKAGDVEVPSKFKLQLPVYFDGLPVTLFAFLRHHLDDGKVRLGISLNRPENVRQAEFKQVVVDIAERTGLKYVFGAL